MSLCQGAIVDATIIHAPSSTKNKEGKRDPEMHQTEKGNMYYFGMKGKRSINPTYHKVRLSFTEAFPVNRSTATAPRSRPPTAHVAAFQVRGAATYKALCR